MDKARLSEQTAAGSMSGRRSSRASGVFANSGSISEEKSGIQRGVALEWFRGTDHGCLLLTTAPKPSVQQHQIDPPVQFALFLDLAQGDMTDFGGTGDMGAAARLQVDLAGTGADADQPHPALTFGRCH